ncbi:MAG TPA: hypothetical protein H9799_09490 [Candidatus Mediterraneibacter merdipullorum]|nr:hypothetical protein [Candidatus Mediterraneibacter merdipullorum]
MNYTEFVCAVEEKLNQRMTGGVRAELHKAVKNNGTERTGVMIESPGVNISPTIYLEEYYERYLADTSIDNVVDEVLKFYDTVRRETSWDCKDILCYEKLKEKVVFKLVNTAKNRRFLDTVPHMAFLDLSVIFYVLLEATKEGTAAMVVTCDHMRRWGIRKETLWTDAVRNVKRLLPAEFFTMSYALREMLKKSPDGAAGEHQENLLVRDDFKRDGLYVLSNRLRSNGAACIAYPHILEMIGNILQSDYYVLPSSVHEVVITPCHREVTAPELDEMVRDINETQVAEEEVLSDHAYLFLRRTGKLCIGSECLAGRGAR